MRSGQYRNRTRRTSQAPKCPELLDSERCHEHHGKSQWVLNPVKMQLFFGVGPKRELESLEKLKSPTSHTQICGAIKCSYNFVLFHLWNVRTERKGRMMIIKHVFSKFSASFIFFWIEMLFPFTVFLLTQQINITISKLFGLTRN